MNYLNNLTDEEINYICSIIPKEQIISFFKKNPKSFSKIKRGFRAKSLKTQAQASAVLFRGRKQQEFSSYIEKYIKYFLENINNNISQIIQNGETKENAWLQILPFCELSDHIDIYFKLTNDEYSEEIISLLILTIKKIKDLSNNNLQTEISYNTQEELINLEKTIDNIKNIIDRSQNKLNNITNLRRSFEQTILNVNKLEQKIELLVNLIQEDTKKLIKTNEEMSTELTEQYKYVKTLTIEINELKSIKTPSYGNNNRIKRPKEIDDFKYILSQNFENLGIKISETYHNLLNDYLCEILFTGKPIIVNRGVSKNLITCISNTLISTQNICSLVFTPEISVEEIDKFLSNNSRILCLDNFIGQFDETILITICEKHKDKIIFLTITYDKTLKYLPEEFIKYCHYINIDRIGIFSQNLELTEPSTIIEEIELSSVSLDRDPFFESFLIDILKEINFPHNLITYKGTLIINEDSFIKLLLFDILPYCIDVLDISPLSISDKLNMYVSNNRTVDYKNLLVKWFT
jgi:hypothetical protein